MPCTLKRELRNCGSCKFKGEDYTQSFQIVVSWQPHALPLVVSFRVAPLVECALVQTLLSSSNVFEISTHSCFRVSSVSLLHTSHCCHISSSSVDRKCFPTRILHFLLVRPAKIHDCSYLHSVMLTFSHGIITTRSSTLYGNFDNRLPLIGAAICYRPGPLVDNDLHKISSFHRQRPWKSAFALPVVID